MNEKLHGTSSHNEDHNNHVNEQIVDNARKAIDRGEYANAIALLRPLAEIGNARAQYSLGLAYHGRQGAEDHIEAAKWICLAAKRAVTDAFDSLSIDHDHCFEKSAKRYQLGAEQGDAEAQCNLGWLYCHGIGVPQNYKMAMHWFGLASEHGNAEAQYNLAVMFQHGRGVARDFDKAFKWYSLAAEQGFEEAQVALRNLYRTREDILLEENEKQ
jgi:TPR repeat protein